MQRNYGEFESDGQVHLVLAQGTPVSVLGTFSRRKAHSLAIRSPMDHFSNLLIQFRHEQERPLYWRLAPQYFSLVTEAWRSEDFSKPA